MTHSDDVQLLADKAQRALRHALRTGKLREGQFLSMAQLVTILECPIAAIRDAVKHASSLGILTTFPKRGVQIMEARPETIRECLDFRMVLDQEGARRRISDRKLSGLEELRVQHQQMRASAQTEVERNLPPKAIEIDLSLHDFLAEGLQNTQLFAAYDANRIRISIIQNARPFLPDRIFSAMEEHLAIIDALEKNDIIGATDAIRHHYERTLRWWGVS